MVLLSFGRGHHEVYAADIVSDASQSQGFGSIDGGSTVRGIFFYAHTVPWE